LKLKAALLHLLLRPRIYGIRVYVWYLVIPLCGFGFDRISGWVKFMKHLILCFVISLLSNKSHDCPVSRVTGLRTGWSMIEYRLENGISFFTTSRNLLNLVFLPVDHQDYFLRW
jgi:hypothetical protein